MSVQLAGKPVGKIGYGLMGLTWRGNPPTKEQSFKAMRAALAHGSNNWNGGEFYGTLERNSLHLLNEYFTEYPEDAEKVVLNIKGGGLPGNPHPDSSPKNIRRSIEDSLSVLDGKKSIDLFECARLDGKVPVEDVVSTIAEYVKAGKVGGISLSEVNGDTIRRAAKVHKIAAVEVEFSLFSTEPLTNGIFDACKENDIAVIAYSPLGRGFLTGQFKSRDDLPEGSLVKEYPRFRPENFENNMALVKEVEKIAKQKGATPAQIALGWILAKSGSDGLPLILPIPGATTEERIKENTTQVSLSNADVAAIDDILVKFPVKGERYPENIVHLCDQ